LSTPRPGYPPGLYPGSRSTSGYLAIEVGPETFFQVSIDFFPDCRHLVMEFDGDSFLLGNIFSLKEKKSRRVTWKSFMSPPFGKG
jgi:hypothetical protein